jgi:hypothetical protein
MEFWKESIKQDAENEKLLVQEGLITSYPYPILQRQLSQHPSVRFVNKRDDDFGITHGFEVHFSTKTTEEQITKIKSIIDVNGYFVSCENRYNIGPGAGLIEYLVEPKFPVLLPNAKLQQYGYHVSPKIYSSKIEKLGLIPKFSKRPQFQFNGNRIYVLLSDNPEHDTYLLINALYRNSVRNDKSGEFQKRVTGPHDYDIFRVDLKGLSFHDFYYDPRLPYKSISISCTGIFTLKNIKPQYIEKISFDKQQKVEFS